MWMAVKGWKGLLDGVEIFIYGNPYQVMQNMAELPQWQREDNFDMDRIRFRVTHDPISDAQN
jgi:hypothetical protein